MMAIHPRFDDAIALMEDGDVEGLRDLLAEHPDLAAARDDGNASLLVRLIDWPGHRPRAAETARVLVDAGVDPEARRDDENGTAMAGALCTGEIDVVRVLLEAGADHAAPLGWMPGTNLDLADRMCQDHRRRHDDDIRALVAMFAKASGRTIPSRPPVGGVTTLLFVADVAAGLAFYRDRLGFHVDWTYEEPDCDPYVGLSRGNAEFHLTGCECPDRRHVGNLWVRIECDDIDDLHDEFVAAGVPISDPPADRPWGFREMRIDDPDGNRLVFHGPTTGTDE